MKKMLTILVVILILLVGMLNYFGIFDLLFTGIEPEAGMTRTSAKAYLETLYEKDDNSVETMIEIASYHYYLGEFDEAKTILEPLVEERTNNFNVYSLLAELYYLEGNYEMSEVLMKSQLDEHPFNFNVQLKTQARLMKIYYQTNQFDKLKHDWAIRIMGFGEFVDWMKNFENQPYALEWNEELQTTLSMLTVDPLPVVEVTINDKPYYFMFDTGADATIIDKRLIEQLNADTSGSFEGDFGGGMTSELLYSSIDAIVMNGLTIHNLPVMFLDISHFDELLTEEELLALGLPLDFKVHGIFGTKVMQQLLATVDYVNGSFILRDKGSFYLEDVKKGMNHNATFDFCLNEMHQLTAKGTINNKPVCFWLDSGFASEAGVLLDDRAYDDLCILRPELVFDENAVSGAGKGYSSGERLASESAGIKDLVMEDIGVGLDPNRSMYWDNGFIIEGMLSHHYLKNYAWTIDFNTMTMQLSN